MRRKVERDVWFLYGKNWNFDLICDFLNSNNNEKFDFLWFRIWVRQIRCWIGKLEAMRRCQSIWIWCLPLIEQNVECNWFFYFSTPLAPFRFKRTREKSKNIKKNRWYPVNALPSSISSIIEAISLRHFNFLFDIICFMLLLI